MFLVMYYNNLLGYYIIFVDTLGVAYSSRINNILCYFTYWKTTTYVAHLWNKCVTYNNIHIIRVVCGTVMMSLRRQYNIIILFFQKLFCHSYP